MSAVVLMPLSLDDEHRMRAAKYVTDRLTGDGWPVIGHGHGYDPWVKALAVDAMVDFSGHDSHADDVLIVHDADVIVDLASLRAAVNAVESGAVEWAIPHRLVHRLTQESTAAFYQGMLTTKPELTRWPYIGVAGGGVCVLRRTTYMDCPLDPRFVGWGNEDQSWGWALDTLHGAPWRGDTDLIHLWHPHPEPGATRSPLMASHRLWRAYRNYRGRPEQMRGLVDSAVPFRVPATG